MIRARIGDTVILGVDAENVRRLKKGKPIDVDLAALGGGNRVIILYGDTLQDIMKELEEAGFKLPPAMPFMPFGDPS